MLQNDAIKFANAPFDRAAHRRKNKDWLKTALKAEDSLFLPFYAGKILCIDNGEPAEAIIPGTKISKVPRKIAWLYQDEIPSFSHCQIVFLGEDKGKARFAISIPTSVNLETSLLADLIQGDLRAISGGISAQDAQYASTAASIFNWHRKHGFCANCGEETHIAEAGWKRECPACETEHFPRVDPVAIMLAVKGDKCLMGRGTDWGERMYSCLAGFVEPGETMEQAAARELFEEAGVVATNNAQYLFCQPWPFPSSLMIGMIVEVENEELTIDENELETARWFTKDEARQILEENHPDVDAPADIAVAYHVLKSWVDAI